jgi:hypothetical protein
MAMRVATMTPLSPVDTSSAVREPSYLFRKLLLLCLLITAAAASIAVLFKNQINFPLLLSTFFADASLGLIAGLGTRYILHKRDWFTQLLFGIVTAIIGMTMIGFFTHWVLGIGPIELERKAAEQIRQIRIFDRDLVDQINSMRIDSRRLLEFHKMDWADPVHLGISLIMTALALRAWPDPAPTLQPVEVVPLPEPTPPRTRTRATRSRRARRTSSSTSSSSTGRATVELPGSWSTRLRPNPAPTPRTRSNNGSRSTVVKEPKKAKEKDQVVRPKRRRSRRKPQIQFALVEEHRCPYCLDAVTHHDPRGVKECDVCHTLHHADCWAITGFCQVPHLNT